MRCVKCCTVLVVKLRRRGRLPSRKATLLFLRSRLRADVASSTIGTGCKFWFVGCSEFTLPAEAASDAQPMSVQGIND